MPSDASSPDDVTRAGDLVRLDYDLWAEGGGRTDLIDTTHEEVAQKSGATPPASAVWGARPHQIGGEYFPSGIESALVGLKVNETLEKEFAPADAFGERDPKLIELFSMHEISRLPEMRREDAHLDIGTVLTIEGRRGRVVTLTQARVRVDFNPPFAGRKVRGTFRITEKVTGAAEQVRAILDLQYGRGSEFHVEVHDQVITLKVPDRSKFDIGWMAAKPRVIDRLRTQLTPKSIKVVEEYVTPKADAAEKTDTPSPEAGGAKPAAGEGHAHPPKPKKATPPAAD